MDGTIYDGTSEIEMSNIGDHDAPVPNGGTPQATESRRQRQSREFPRRQVQMMALGTKPFCVR